jgi:20S proteasome alpha/beta subunit
MARHHLLSSLLLVSVAVVGASRYATYDYDLTTPQFTPDGRLLQVEYATNACVREGSNPILTVGFGDGDEAVIVMATVSSDASSDVSDGADEDGSVSKSVNQRTQYRIVEVPISAAFSSLVDSTNDVSAITTSTVLVGLTGHLSDANSLLHTIYSQLEEEESVFGWHRLGLSPAGQDASGSGAAFHSTTTETALRLSRAAADQCQKHAFGGGLRPIGASLLLGAVDLQQRIGRIAMCKTYPSGNLDSIVYGIKSDEVVVPQVMVSGGSSKSQEKLQTLIESQLKELTSNDEILARKVLRSVVLSLVDEWRGRQQLQLSGASKISKLYQRSGGSNPIKTNIPRMEVVVASSKVGSFRLSDKDISAVIKDYVEDS